MQKFKVEAYDRMLEFVDNTFTDDEAELYAEIGRLMHDEDKEILGIFCYDLERNKVEKGEIKLDEKAKRFVIEWEVVWEA